MTALPPELQYGHVVGRVILAVADSGDADTFPDAVPAQGTVTFTPKNPEIRVGEPDPVVVLKQKIACTIDAAGHLTDPDGKRGVWLVTGVYTVSYSFTAASLPAHDIVVAAEHTQASPLDLTLALPPGGPVLQPSQYAELTARIDSLVFEAAGVSSVNGATGAVVLDAADVGALPSTYTPPAQTWNDVTSKPETFAPTAHAASHATGGSDPIAPADIGAATAAQGTKADTAVQPDDVADVIREGDARLTDARTPTTHGHDDRYYTETESDTRYVRTVNGTGPDGSGNVAVAGGGGSSIPQLPVQHWSLPGLNVTGTGSEDTIADYLYLSPFVVSPARTLTGVLAEVATAFPAGATAAMGIYRWTSGHDWERVLNAGTVNITTIGPKVITLNAPLTAGLYALATVASASGGKFGCWATAGGAYGSQMEAVGITGNKFVYYGKSGVGLTLPATVTGEGAGGFDTSFTRGAVRLA